MKPCLKNRNGKKACVKIFSEHKFRHYLRMNAAPHIGFNTLITTYTDNYTAYIDYLIITLIFTTHYSTRFSFLQTTSSLLRNNTMELMTYEAVSFEKVFDWKKFLAFDAKNFFHWNDSRKLKAWIYCEIFLSEHFMKYEFHDSFIV